MPTNVDQITSAEWSLSLSGQGSVEQGFDDINQCLQIIVSTQRGTDPLRPNFGCDMWRFMDGPITEAAPRMVSEMLDAIATWEERVDVTGITYDLGKDSVFFNIGWVLRDSQERGAAQITLAFAPDELPDAPPVLIAPIASPVLSAVYTYPDTQLDWVFENPTGVTFQILRSANGGVFVEIAEVFGVLEYTDADAPKDSELSYIVRAIKGGRVSEFSNTATVQSIEAVLSFLTSDPSYIDLVGAAELVETTGGITKVYLPTDAVSSVTAFYSDDAGDADLNAGISGNLNLDDRFTGLRDVRSRNQNFGFVSGDWVKNTDVSINVENSVITDSRVNSIIDSIIISNGGTVSDDGSNYTGTAGETHANRSLNLGSIELDLSDPANSILFQKITALEGVGWTITTIKTLCQKRLIVNTAASTYIASSFEKSRELIAFQYVSGGTLDISLYDTEANAEAGGATGLLADGYAAVDAWLRDDSNYNNWVSGNPKGIRFEAVDGTSTNNQANLSYKAFPTADRACGDNTLGGYLSGNAKVYDGSFDYDEIAEAVNYNYTGFSVLINLFITRNDITEGIFDTRIIASGGLNRAGVFIGVINGAIRFFLRDDNNSVVRIDAPFELGKNSIVATYSAASFDAKIYINGINSGVIVDNQNPQIFTETNQQTRIGKFAQRDDGSDVGNLFTGFIKQGEFINRIATPAEIAAASDPGTGGSFRAAGITHGSGDYALAVDFDKENGNPPTTFAGTPSYSITSFGGAEYVDYPSL